MAKTTEQSNSETLVFKASSVDAANKLRRDMIEEFPGCWFYVYTNTSEIWVCNEFGGKIKKDVLEKLITFCSQSGKNKKNLV